MRVLEGELEHIAETGIMEATNDFGSLETAGWLSTRTTDFDPYAELGKQL